MAADAFNSLGGYTVGIPAVNVVDSNGNVVTNVLALTGNVATRNLYANNYFWSNGVPFTGSGEPMGPFTSVQFNDSGLFNGSANFTYDNGNNILSVIRANVSYLTAYESVITANLGVSDLATLANIYVTNTANIELLNVSNIANVTNLYISNTANLGAVSNVTITGGNSGYLLTTDGHGVLQWSPPGTGSAISNGASNVDIGTYSGNITASVNGNTNVVIITANGLIVNGNVSATTFTGNLSGSAATVTANAQPNITSVGTLTSLVVTGNITSGNANLGNLATANYFTGILTTNAQPNITSVGTLTSLDVSGNISGGNITTIGQVVATGNITGNYFIGNGSQLTGIDATSIQNGNSNVKVYANANISTSVAGVANVLVVTGVGANVDGTLGVTGNLSASNLVITGTGLFDGNVSMNTHSITNLAEPINDADAATKYYVDSTAQGLDPKASVVAATTGNITLFGPQLIDGISIVATNRVLVKNQSQPADNGLYLCTDAAWTRTADMNNWAEVPSSYVFVETGTLDGGTGWVCTSPPGGTLGVTPITWVQFSGSGTYTAGAGLTLTGTEFSVNAAQPTITSVGTLTSLEVTGNVSAGNVSATTFTGNLTGNASGSAATVTTNAQPNITSTGTLTSLDVTGNVSAGNISATTFTGNISATYVSGTLTTNAQPNITSTGTLTSLDVTGNVSAGNVSGTLLTGTLTTNAQPNVTSVGTLTSLDVTGNVSAGNVSGTLLTGTLTTAAQPNITSTGTLTSLAVTGNVSAGNVSGTLLTGTLTTNAQPNITSTGTLTSLAVTGNVSAGNISATYVSGTLTTNAQPNVTSVGTLTSLDVTGNITTIGNISGDYFIGNGSQLTGVAASNAVSAGTVTTNAQPNITSVGNLTGLTVSNSTGTVDFANTANVTLGDISNLHIAGGTSGYVLSTDGNGNLTWTNSSVVGNAVPIGLPTDGDLTTNVAYSGWSTSTVVTDGLDDLNQVSLNIAGNTFVGNVYITSNVTSGPSPLSVAFTGHYIGNPTNHLWQFGDGTANSTLANPTHTYSNVAGGQFTVTYTAYNTNGTYGGNALNGAKGSVATSTNANYILLYTPMPIPTFTTSPTTLDTGSIVTITNTSLYATSYTINYGDGNSAVNPGNTWTTNSHTYNNSANVDTICGINLTGINQSAGGSPPYSVTSANTNVKIYTQQSPAITANILTTINYFATSGGQVQFRNDTPGSPGNTASFGAQQLYNFNWGDGTANSNVNIGSGIGGNPGAANLTHTFTLTTVQQNAATTVNYTANMWLYTGYSTSPFKTANVTISIEPEIRANFVGTSNTQTDATGYASNAQVGYLYTDYNGYDRSLFNFINDTSPNISFTGNSFTWTWGDTTSNAGVTSRAIISHSYLASSVGAKTVALLGTGSPGTISQSNTNTKTAYITILANPTPPSNLSSYTNVTMATASQGTSPLLAAGANDNTGGNIVANGTSVTRVASTTPVSTSTQVTNANTALTGTLTAYVNNSAQGLATFSTSGNAVGTYTSLIISADRDLHIANAAVPTGFYKVFSATISNTLASLGNGYNDFQMRHSVSGNTNTVGMVKDNLNSVPTIVTTNVVMATATAGTYRYISGIPYYSATGSPAVTVSATELQNFTGQTFRSADPYTISSGTSYEGSGSIISTQTKSLAQLDGATTMLTGSNVKANIGIGTNYVLGNLNILINGAVNGVSTLQANIFNVVGTSTTVQLPIKIQNYAGANSGLNEQAITANVAGNTQAAIRIVMSTAGNTPVFSDSTNFYTSNVWSGAQTIAGTPEAVVRYGVLKHFAVDLSTGYLPTGPNLSTGRSGLQYFTFAFVRPSLANFDIILTTGATGLSGLWVAAPGTTIDKGGFSSPTAGYPGPTSTINGWLTGFEQYNGSGVPGKSATGGNPAGTDGCAFTGADVIPLNTLINNVRYTMTLGSQNQANSTGNNILIRIALAAGQTITDLQIGVAT